MSTDKSFDPEKYLNFHYGKKVEYTRQAVITAMSGFLQASLSQIINGAIAGKPKPVRQGFQIEVRDPVYGAACEIKNKWMTEGLITPSQADTFGAFDLYFKLKAGISEDMIHPSMVIAGFLPDQREGLNEKFNKN